MLLTAEPHPWRAGPRHPDPAYEEAGFKGAIFPLMPASIVDLWTIFCPRRTIPPSA